MKWGILVISLLLSGCGGSCSKFFMQGNGGASVTVEKVHFQTASPEVTIVGELTPNNQSTIRFATPVTIEKIYVAVGQPVEENTPLLKLSDNDLTNQLNLARAKLKEAESLTEKNRYLLTNRDKLLEEEKIDGTQYGGLPSEVQHNESSAETIKAEIASIEYQLDKLTVGCPISGHVISIQADAGQQLEANQPIMTIGHLDPIMVMLPLSSNESMGIHTGSPLQLILEDIPGETLNSTVSAISPDLQQSTRTFNVWAAIPNPDLSLKVGMKVSAKFTSTAQHRVAIVPVSAILLSGRQAAVFTVRNGMAYKTPITISERREKNAIIQEGLAEGDLIVTNGVETLEDGMVVDVWR